MMQKCSELGTMAWQHFVRFGQNNLKVKKGPDGHYLESRCREELQKSLPAESFEELMAWVAKWLKRLDEKNAMVRSQEVSPQDTRDKVSDKDLPAEKEGDKKTPADPAVVDLCSDGENEESVGPFSDKETLDSESVISSSSLVILDDELGEVNLKDYADHVDGKLDEASLRKRNRREEPNTPSKAKKQTSMKAFLTPNGKKIEKSPSPVFRRSLKTYVKRPKIPASGEAMDLADTNEKRRSLILRELNIEGGNNLNSSSKEESIPEVITITDDSPSQEYSANKEEKPELPNEKTKPKTLAHFDTIEKPPIDEDPSQNATKYEKLKPDDLIDKETPPCDSYISKEIKSKSESDVSKVAIKCESEVPLGASGEAKENSEPGTNKEGPNPTITKDDSPKNEAMPVLTELLAAVPQVHQEPTHDSSINPEEQPDPLLNQRPEPNTIRIRSDLVSCPMDTIRVRTDLLQEHVDRVQPEDTLNQLRDHVDRISTAQPANPPGAAEKRRLPPETPGNQCGSTSTSLHGQPKRPALDNYNPAPVSTSRYPHPPTIAVPAAPANTSGYRLIAPAPAIANGRYPLGATGATSSTSSYLSPVFPSSYQPEIPPAPHTISNYQSNGTNMRVYSAENPAPLAVNAPANNNTSYPVAQGSGTNSRYPQEIPVSAGNITNTNYQSFMPVAPGSANSVWYPPPRFPSSNPVASSPATTVNQPARPAVPPAAVISSSYQPVMSAAPGSVPTSRCPPHNPLAPAPVVTSSYQPVESAAPRSVPTYRCPPPNPVAPAAIVSSSYRPVMSAAPGSSRYPPPNPVAPAAIVSSNYRPVMSAAPESSRYPPPNPVAPAAIVSSNYRPVMSAAPGSSRYPPPNPVAHAAVVSSSYQPMKSAVSGSVAPSRYPPPCHVAPAAVVTSVHQTIKPLAPAPVASSRHQPSNPVAPAPQYTSNNQLTGCSTNLSNIMGMLAQVEFFAYAQKNQEAFHLVNQLRLSLQKGAANNCNAPQRKV